MRALNLSHFILIGLISLICGCSSSSSKSIKIGIDPTFYPLQSGNKDIYVFAFFNELLEEIARLKKIRIERINRSWDNLIEGLNKHEYDIVFSIMEPRIYNEEMYSFSPIILSTGPVAIVPVHSPIHHIDELTNTIVGIEEFSQAVVYISRDPSIVLSYYMSPPQALNSLVAGNCQAVIMDEIIATSYVNSLYQEQLRILPQPLISQGIRALSLRETKSGDLQIIQEAINELKEKGIYAALLKKWHLTSF